MLAGVLMQESRYKLAAKRRQCGYSVKNEKKIVCIITDYGISQVHFKNIERYQLDKKKLLTDLEYSVNAGAMILAEYSKYKVKEPKTWYCRYNVGVRSFNEIQSSCITYIALVQRYF